jgi:hypothetical protein
LLTSVPDAHPSANRPVTDRLGPRLANRYLLCPGNGQPKNGLAINERHRPQADEL